MPRFLIHRGSVAIPNPRGDREILAGDVLLCFGKTLTLKSLAPRNKRTRRRRRPEVKLATVVESAEAAAGLEITPAALVGDEPVDTAPPIPEFEEARWNPARDLASATAEAETPEADLDGADEEQ